MTNIKDIAWLAGIFEGEGAFDMFSPNSHPRMSLAMTDLDVVIRFADIVGCECVREKRHAHPGKPLYVARIGGRRAIEWLMTLYALMGERRKEQIEAILRQWKTSNRAGDGGARMRNYARKSPQTIVWQRLPQLGA